VQLIILFCSRHFQKSPHHPLARIERRDNMHFTFSSFQEEERPLLKYRNSRPPSFSFPSSKACAPCPKPAPCPTINCENAARTAFEQGEKKGKQHACQGICQVVYHKCREINPNTALCYQVSEFCAETCGK